MSWSVFVEIRVLRVQVIRVEPVNVSVLGVEKEQLRKIIPIAVKNAFAVGNIGHALCVHAGRPVGSSLVTVVRLVLGNVVDQAVIVEAKFVKTRRVQDEVNAENDAERPSKRLCRNVAPSWCPRPFSRRLDKVRCLAGNLPEAVHLRYP